MFLRIDRLQIELPMPKEQDPNAAAAVQALLGGRFGDSTFELKATIPPNALTESHSKAFKNALEAELLIEAPQGLLCFRITEAKVSIVI